MTKNLLITCGGTGGHFYPGLSVAVVAQQSGHRVALLLSGVNSVKQSEIARKEGIDSVILRVMPSPSIRRPISVWRFGIGLIHGYIKSRKYIAEFKPDAVLGMGSFASLPVMLAAHRSKTAVFLHDGNARIGRANRFLSRWAQGVYTAFPAVNANKIHCQCECIGMPLRQVLVGSGRISKAAALAELNKLFAGKLQDNLPTLLIFGGSQGAAIFNQVLPRVLLEMSQKSRFQVLHLTGQGKLVATRNEYTDAKFPFLALESSERMELFLDAADLVISRAGGSSIAELAAFGKPAILIPYPCAAENHQVDNAHYPVDSGAALMLENSECTFERMLELLKGLYFSQDQLRVMSAAATKIGRKDAAQKMLLIMGFSVV